MSGILVVHAKKVGILSQACNQLHFHEIWKVNSYLDGILVENSPSGMGRRISFFIEVFLVLLLEVQLDESGFDLNHANFKNVWPFFLGFAIIFSLV